MSNLSETIARAMCPEDPKFGCDGCPNGCEAPNSFLESQGYFYFADAAIAAYESAITLDDLRRIAQTRDLPLAPLSKSKYKRFVAEEDQQETLRKLKLALTFYADTRNWMGTPRGPGDKTGICRPSPISFDKGETARTALKETP